MEPEESNKKEPKILIVGSGFYHFPEDIREKIAKGEIIIVSGSDINPTSSVPELKDDEVISSRACDPIIPLFKYESYDNTMSGKEARRQRRKEERKNKKKKK